MKIKDICTSITDGSHNPPQGISESNFLMLSSKNVFDDCITTDEPRYLSKEDYERENKRTRIQPGDVLLTIVGTVGRAAVVPNDISPFALQRSVAVLHPKTDICSSRFLMYALRSKRTYIENSAKGVAQKGIYLGEVDSIDLPVPSMKQQAEIIDTLDRTNAVIRKRQQQLQAFDTLIKARFVEMFGDPVSNSEGWRVVPWEGVFDTKTGKLDSNAAVEGGEYPFFTCAKEWLWIDKYAYDCEALLLAGNNAAGVYDVKHYKGKFNAYQRTYILQLRDADWSYSLFKYQLEDRLQYLQSQSKGTNTRYLTMGILNSLAFIVPPNELQDEFTTLVSQVDKSKVVVQAALDKAQLLFNSLMQQYFG